VERGALVDRDPDRGTGMIDAPPVPLAMSAGGERSELLHHAAACDVIADRTGQRPIRKTVQRDAVPDRAMRWNGGCPPAG